MLLRATYIMELAKCSLACFVIGFLTIVEGSADYRQWGRGYRANDLETHNYKNQIKRYEWKDKKRGSSITLHQRTVPTPERAQHYDWACISQPNGFSCGYCSMTILCTQGAAFLQPCPPDFACKYPPAFTGAAVCYPKPFDIDCQCSGVAEFKADPYNPLAYFECKANELVPSRTEMCPENHEFNPDSSTCEPIADFPECVLAGTFPHVNDCRWFYTCSAKNDGNGWTRMFRRCMQPGTVYSAAIEGCAEPDSLPASEVCSSIARAQSTISLTGQLASITPGNPASASFFPAIIPSPVQTPTVVTQTVIITQELDTAVLATLTTTPAPPRYICTAFARLIIIFLPNWIETFCVRINK